MFIFLSVLLLIYFTTWYIVAYFKKNASIIDIGWGLGFVIVSVFGFINNPSIISFLILLLVGLWGIRLSFHIFLRNHGKPEDFRYANFRKNWGKIYYVRSYFQLFLFQGLLMYIISLSFIFTQLSDKTPNYLFVLTGTFIWIFGFAFEAIGDYQLKKHIKDINNKGKLISTGLWKYTRHPNYFGEATLWWGIFVIGLSVGNNLFTIISPLTITLVIRFLSGVPMLEKSLKKYQGYDTYVKSTSIFIPWFPKK